MVRNLVVHLAVVLISNKYIQDRISLRLIYVKSIRRLNDKTQRISF